MKPECSVMKQMFCDASMIYALPVKYKKNLGDHPLVISAFLPGVVHYTLEK